MAIPAGEIWNVLPVETVIGSPVHDPNRYRTVAPEFQISSPTRDQPDPEFVHEIVPELDVAPALAAFHAIELPPVVYPPPPASWVMVEPALGAVVPSRMLVADTAEKALSFRISARISVAIAVSNIAITRDSLQAVRSR
jgi:hypothetical protein